MSVIILPGKHTKRPRGRVQANPVFDPAGLWDFNSGPMFRCLVSGKTTDASGVAMVQQTVYGTYVLADSYLQNQGFTLNHAVQSLGQMTVVSIARRIAGSVGLSLLSANWNGVYTAGFMGWTSSTSANFDGDVQFTESRKLDGAFVGSAAARGAANDFRISVGSGVKEDTATAQPSGVPVIHLGAAWEDNRSDIEIQMLGIISRSVSNGELEALAENPWQLFRADPVRIYSIPSAGFPISINVAASNLTATGARITATLGF